MYQLNPLFEGSESVRMMMATKKAINNAKNKIAYHDRMVKIYAAKMADMVETKGALMDSGDKVVFSALRKAQNHHAKMFDKYQAGLETLKDQLTDIRISMGTLR